MDCDCNGYQLPRFGEACSCWHGVTSNDLLKIISSVPCTLIQWWQILQSYNLCKTGENTLLTWVYTLYWPGNTSFLMPCDIIAMMSWVPLWLTSSVTDLQVINCTSVTNKVTVTCFSNVMRRYMMTSLPLKFVG